MRICQVAVVAVFVALASAPARAAEPAAGGPWVVSQDTDSFSDKATVRASAKGKGGNLALIFDCDAKKSLTFTAISLKGAFGGEFKPSGIKWIDVDFRADALPAHSFRFLGKSGFAFLMQDDASFPILRSEAYASRQKLLLRSTLLTGGVVSDEISTVGLKQAFGRVENACGK